jgi:SAM-dependent methyltransferase
LAQWFQDFSGKTIRVLDLGCGEGDEIAEAISQVQGKNFEIWANDTSEEALALYEKILGQYVKRKVLWRLEDLPDKIAGEKFDLILFSHSLYSIKLDGLFEKYVELLEEDGQVIVFMDVLENEFKQLQIRFWRDVHGTDFFDDENVAETIKDHLCSIEEVLIETFSFDYDIDIGKLIQINSNGIRELFIPFAMRMKSHNLDNEIKDQGTSFVDKLVNNENLQGRAMIITVRRE